MHLDPKPAYGTAAEPHSKKHMKFLDWNPDWEIGIGKIDAQHRALLEQTDALMLAVYEKEGDQRIPELLPFLVSYVDMHFREEEEAMAATGYPGLAAHRQIHQDLQAKVASLLDLFQQDPSIITEAVLDFLVGWLVDHINGEDRVMAGHFRSWAKVHPDSDLPQLFDLKKRTNTEN